MKNNKKTKQSNHTSKNKNTKKNKNKKSPENKIKKVDNEANSEICQVLIDIKVKQEYLDETEVPGKIKEEVIEGASGDFRIVKNNASTSIDNGTEEVEVKIERIDDDYSNSCNNEDSKTKTETENCFEPYIDIQPYSPNRESPTNETSHYSEANINDFYVIKTLTLVEMERAREFDRNVSRYNLSPYRCETCVLGYFHESFYQKHVLDKHSEKAGTHVCNICEQRFFNEANLESHYKEHFNGYQCKLCKFAHPKYSQMDFHYTREHKGDRHRCKICGDCFRSYRSLRYHRDTTHKELPKCKRCGRKFKTTTILKRHMLTHTSNSKPSFKCKLCGDEFSNLRTLVQHRKDRHSQALPDSPHCELCGITFKNMMCYKNHVNFSSKHKPPRDTKFECDDCHRTFQLKTSLKRHIMVLHSVMADKNNMCHLCDKQFTRGDRLRQHIKYTHEGVTKVKDKICLTCGKAFAERRILVGHMRVHTGEKPFHCPHCDSSFAQKGTLRSHLKAKHKDVIELMA